MFVSVSREASECRLYAEQCADRARLESDPKLRQDFLDMERRWLSLARCYEFPERLEYLLAIEASSASIGPTRVSLHPLGAESFFCCA
jgi:hypothetical protein